MVLKGDGEFETDDDVRNSLPLGSISSRIVRFMKS